VDHVVAPLDPDHARVVAQLSHDLAAELGIDPEGAASPRPHITVASYAGLEPVRAAVALAPVLAAVAPFTVRAHGYGVFAGDSDSELSLHVMVVRTGALDDLHHRLHGALCAAGACVAGTTGPATWTPHITLLDRGLTPRLLGDAVEILTRRSHRTWSIPVTAVTVASRGAREATGVGLLPLCGTTPGATGDPTGSKVPPPRSERRCPPAESGVTMIVGLGAEEASCARCESGT
jgi:2'-5' RNA ligase